MRFDRDQIDRNSVMDRQGGIAALITLASYLDTDSDIYAIIELGSLKAYLDTDSTTYGRLQITALLGVLTDTDSDIYALVVSERLLSAYTDTDSDVEASLLLSHLMQAYLDTDSDVDARLRVSALLGALLDTDSDVYGVIEMGPLRAYLDTDSDAYALLRLIASFTFTYAGTIAPGEVLCIDGDKFQVTLDGVDAFVDFSGEYPRISPGTNWIVYTDSEGSRTVELIVTKKDRMV